ncbi:hypothetical protein Tco_0020384 [Tanacetum coccineum]
MDENMIRLLLKDQADAAEKQAQQQVAAFQMQFDVLRAELQATRGLLQTRYEGGGDLGSMLPRSMRLDVPKFNGADPESWIFSITEYFVLLNTPTADGGRVQLGRCGCRMVLVDDKEWLITDRDRFVESVKSHFGPSKYEDPQGALLKLLQLGAVEYYQREFEKLLNRVMDISDSLLISFYISGLKLNLQHELLVSRPTTLGDAFSLAHIIEARFEATIKGSLNADENIGVDEVSSAIDCVFYLGESNVESMDVCSKFGEFSDNKKSVEEVVSGGEALGVGEDDDSSNAATNEGDDAVESGDISILSSLIGHGSPRSPQLWGTIGTTDVQVLIEKGADKEVQYYVYTLHVLILFLNSLNDKYIKK